MEAAKVEKEGYEVRWFNHSKICINGKWTTLKKGKIIKKNALIKWHKDWQAMKVVDTKTKKWYQLLARPKRNKVENIWDIINGILLRIGTFSTHDPGQGVLEPVDSLRNTILEEYELLDSITISTSLPVNETQYFEATYEYGDSIIFKKLKCLNGSIIIDKSVFCINDTIIDSQIIPIQIDYINESFEEFDPRRDTPIKREIVFYIIPFFLQDE